MPNIFSPDGPALGSPAQPPPPTGDDDNGGRDHRDEHKLTVMLILSHFIYARVRGLSKLSGLSLGYVQQLLEELEEEGLVRVVQRQWSRTGYFIERTIKRKAPPIGHDLTAELTEEGRNHPKLVRLLDDLERERRRTRELTRPQRWFLGVIGMVVALLIVALLSVQT